MPEPLLFCMISHILLNVLAFVRGLGKAVHQNVWLLSRRNSITCHVFSYSIKQFPLHFPISSSGELLKSQIQILELNGPVCEQSVKMCESYV